ncbi:MAG: hypothetical protein WC721_11620 [Victivallaceae bacterium]|jgi:hypothetical protein
MNLLEIIGRELESDIEIEMIHLPKYGKGSCLVRDFETENGCWNIEVDFSVENGGIDALCFERTDCNDEEPVYVEETNEIKFSYPALFEKIVSAIFEKIK